MGKRKLYQEEHALLNKLVATASGHNKETEQFREAVKRTISRINDELKQVEKEA